MPEIGISMERKIGAPATKLVNKMRPDMTVVLADEFHTIRFTANRCKYKNLDLAVGSDRKEREEERVMYELEWTIYGEDGGGWRDCLGKLRERKRGASRGRVNKFPQARTVDLLCN